LSNVQLSVVQFQDNASAVVNLERYRVVPCQKTGLPVRCAGSEAARTPHDLHAIKADFI
jgi:hypothetical protein